LITISPSVFHGPTGENVLFVPTVGQAGPACHWLELTPKLISRLQSARRAASASATTSASK